MSTEEKVQENTAEKQDDLMQPIKSIEACIEAIVFAAGYPVPYQKLSEVIGIGVREVKRMTERIAKEYNNDKHGIMLLTLDKSCQFCTKEQYGTYIREALGIRRGGNLSASSMEVLAVVAYNQPVTRAFIDAVRGVDSNYAVNSLIDKELIDGVMVGHHVLKNIDPDRPASLSRPVLDILRKECGFQGFYITDALNMMGVVLKYGNHITTPMAVGAGCDIPLSWGIPCKEAYKALLDGYRDGMITDEQLALSVDRVLTAQHKVTLLPKNTEILPEDVENIQRINRECISAVCAEGYTPTIDPEGRHLFVIMTDGTVALDDSEYDAFSGKSYDPVHIAKTIRSLFPHSGVLTHPDHPNYEQNMTLFKKQQEYDDIVYITYYAAMCFIGRECLTPRTVDMMDALQSTDRIIAHLHFGNPFVATDAPFVPRVLLGWLNKGCIDHTLKILAGKAECLGTQPYAEYLRFHKKGDVIC